MAGSPDALLKELDGVWRSLGEQSASEGQDPVLRARAMTFIVVTAKANGLENTLADLAQNYPSRTVVVYLEPDRREFETRVFAQCWMPFGRRQQICSERVEFRTRAEGVDDLHPYLLALAAPDLPVALYHRAPLEPGWVDRSPVIAQKLIVDSGLGGDAGASLAQVTSARRVIADLSWTRLTRWREMIAQLFQNITCRKRLGALDGIEIRFGGNAPPPSALYLGAWLAQSLGWTAAQAQERVRFVQSPQHRQIAGVALSGGGLVVSAACGAGEMIELQAGDVTGSAAASDPDEAALLSEELGILGRDAVFERALRFAVEAWGAR